MIINSKELILKAYKNKYAIPAFNVHNLENMRACVQAAYKMQSPVILACTPSTFTFSGIKNIIAIANSLSDIYSNIPIVLHMDHHHDYESIKIGLENGIKSVMIDASSKSFAENVELTKKVVDLAKKYGATVEAELGAIPGVEDDLVVHHVLKDDPYTTPESVKKFVESTNVDSIAVAIGNAHGIYLSKPKLNINRLKEITNLIKIPLVLHGGSGLTDEQIQKCIDNGVAKVNIGTELKPPYANSLIKYFKDNPKGNDPRYFLAPAVKNIQKCAENRILCCRSSGTV